MLGLGDDSSRAGPTVARLVVELAEDPAGLAAVKVRKLRLDPGIEAQRQETIIFRHTKDEVDVIALAPGHDGLAAETRVATDDDLALRPTGANLSDDPIQIDLLRRCLVGFEEKSTSKRSIPAGLATIFL
jgi:hypothetical protein